jgi:DNA helicase-2/ATP-dependent DNA helicase PcrA
MNQPPRLLTDAQLRLATTTTSVFVSAGPGAGKTHALIARLLDPPQPEARRGVAMLSFTHAVVDEATRRAAARPAILRTPNFVGTIDSFINTFIVGPEFATLHHRAPRFYSGRAELPGALFNVGTRILSLEWFEPRPDDPQKLQYPGMARRWEATR